MEPDLEVVEVAKNGEEAIARCIELQPKSILMDIHMPLVNGVDATKRIKESGDVSSQKGKGSGIS